METYLLPIFGRVSELTIGLAYLGLLGRIKCNVQLTGLPLAKMWEFMEKL